MVECEQTSERLIHLAHELVSNVVTVADTVVDATAGNGHDTIFLRERVGSAGIVYAVDIQADALREVRSRLDRKFQDGAPNVILMRGCHATLDELLPGEAHKNVACIMFNLGYLPGADRGVKTLPSTTGDALMASLHLLRAGGVLTVLVYPGHPGGNEELDAVNKLVRSTTSVAMVGIRWRCYVSEWSSDTAPLLFVAHIDLDQSQR